MRHKTNARKFSRTASHRKAMWRNMATSLFREGKIRTTRTKAMELRRVADRLVTLAKRAAQYQDSDEKKVLARKLHLRRQALGFLKDKAVVAKLFDEIAEKYLERSGGYTRVIKLGQRRGDGAEVAIIELVEEEIAEKKKKRSKKSAKKSSGKTAAPKPKKEAKATEEAPEEAAVEEAPAEEAPAEEPVAEEAPAEEAAEEAPAEEAAPEKAEEEPVAEAPAEEEEKKSE